MKKTDMRNISDSGIKGYATGAAAGTALSLVASAVSKKRRAKIGANIINRALRYSAVGSGIGLVTGAAIGANKNKKVDRARFERIMNNLTSTIRG